MAYYTPTQVYDALVDQGYSEDQALAMASAMGGMRRSGDDIQRGFAAIGAEGAALPSGQHGATDTPLWTNVGDALGTMAGAKFGPLGWLVGGTAGSIAGEKLSGENYYERAGLPAMGTELALGLGLGAIGERVGAGYDRKRRAAFNKLAGELGEGELQEYDKNLKWRSSPKQKWKNRAAVKAANKKLAKIVAAKSLGRLGGGRLGAVLGGTLGSIVPGPGTAIGAAIGGGLGTLAGGLAADWIMPDQQLAVEDDPNMDRPGEAVDPWKGVGTLTGIGAGALALSPYGRGLRRAIGRGADKLGGEHYLRAKQAMGKARDAFPDNSMFRDPLSVDAAKANPGQSAYRRGYDEKMAEYDKPASKFGAPWREIRARQAGRGKRWEKRGEALYDTLNRLRAARKRMEQKNAV